METKKTLRIRNKFLGHLMRKEKNDKENIRHVINKVENLIVDELSELIALSWDYLPYFLTDDIKKLSLEYVPRFVPSDGYKVAIIVSEVVVLFLGEF